MLVRTNKNEVYGFLALYLSIVLLGGLGLLYSFFVDGRINFFYPSKISIISLVFFIPLIIYACLSFKNYFLFFFIIILGFPSAVNDFLPGVQITSSTDSQLVYIPFLTHIDFYLLIGIIFGIIRGSYNQYFKVNIKILLTLFLLICSFLISAFIYSQDIWDYNLVTACSIHLRFLILVILLFQIFKIEQYEKQLINGLYITIVLIFCEALIFTTLNGYEEMISGNYGKNTFANLFAGLLLFIYELLKRKKINKILFLFMASLMIFAIMKSGTRGAIVSFVIGLILIYLFENKKNLVKNLFKGLGIFLALLMFYQILLIQDKIPDRYSYQNITEKIHFKKVGSTFSNSFDIEPSWETNSIISRFRLFDSSLNMISNYPLVGIGAGRWNRYKTKYNPAIEEKVLLDSHNDYLALLSQYGIPLGAMLILIVFLYPYTIIENLYKNTNNRLIHLVAVNILMSVAAISNSGFFKYQIAAFLIFNFVLLFYLKSKISNKGDELP